MLDCLIEASASRVASSLVLNKLLSGLVRAFNC